MRFSATRGPIGLALLCITFAGTVSAEYNPSNEYRDHIKVAQTVQPLGDKPFGEEINMYKGGLSFRHTDISYPGIGPTITLTRNYTVGGGSIEYYTPKAFGDWSLVIPRIETILPGDRFSNFGEWKTGNSYSRCSSFSMVSVSPYTTLGMHWWNGYQLVTPDGASQPILRRVTENTLKPSSGSYNIVTNSNWMIGCIPLSNATGVNGIQGEGFLALAPDGTKYYFDYLVYGPPIPELLYEASQPAYHLPRKLGYMYVSKIEDRFGNYITYNYSGSTLNSITGSDGRQVTITRNGNVSSITIQPGTPAAQTWTYGYTNGILTSVDLPDHSKWLFSMNGVNGWETTPDPGASCGGTGSSAYETPTTITVTHPSGLVGAFNVGWHEFGRSKVPNVCNPATLDSPEYDTLPPYYYAVALNSKSISGPGVATQTWTYTYGAEASTDPNCGLTGCVAASSVEVGAPDGTSTRYTHSAEWGYYEGKLLSVVSGITASQPGGLQTALYEYAAPTQGPYPARLGDNTDNSYTVNNGTIEYLTPEKKVTTNLQSVAFVRTINQFDPYANPVSITRSSTGNAGGNFSRTETMTYSHDTAKWVLGQVATVTDSLMGLTSKTDYDSAALPWKRYGFGGLLQQTLTYNANGTIASVKDGNNNTISLGNWYRGVPRLITFPAAETLSATVDDAGKILSTTDELNSSTSYSYDAMGRLSGITYPTGDSVVWNPLSRGFVPVATAEYGLPAGHWKQTVQTGNGKTTTFYDARFLPVLTLTEDTGSAGSQSFVLQRFDGLGRATFKSYPVAAATVGDSLPGITTFYDALGRPTQVKQDSELGLLTTTTEYLSGFQTRVTNPRGYQTTTSYEVFDTPNTDAPVRIDAPQGVTTVITRDLLGAPLTITRSGPGN